MKRHTDDEYIEYNTIRQWAKQGFLPKEGAQGIELWANSNYQDSYTYYSPEEVYKATPEKLKDFFKPERDRRNALAKKRREQKRAEQEQERKVEQKKIIDEAIQPYLKKIAELQKIIRTISKSAKHSSDIALVIDTETTGFDPEDDELLQLSIIDTDGNVLFDSYFRPCLNETWKEAERVHHISPETVKNAPSIAEKIAEINSIIYQADTIIGYNINFDLGFLHNNGLMISDDVKIIDVMSDFSVVYDEYSEYYGDYKWQKLSTAADYYGYDWNSQLHKAHNSLADCFATLHVYKSMRNEQK